jgi:hypothetical protein
MDETNDIEKLFNPAKPERKRGWALLPCKVLPNGCLARKLQNDGVFQGAKISNNATVVPTKALIDKLLSFQEV